MHKHRADLLNKKTNKNPQQFSCIFICYHQCANDKYEKNACKLCNVR